VGGANRRRRWATRVAVASGLPVGSAGDGSVRSGRRCGCRVAGGSSRRPRAKPRSVGMWERVVAAVNLVSSASTPLPFYIARATGGHQPYGLDAPDQGVFKGSGPIFGSGPWRSTPTFSSLISHCSYSCSVSEFGPSHRRSVYRACLVMTVITIRLIATITFPV